MAYPTIYSVTYSYTGFQQSQGNNAFPGTQIDSDLAGLEGSIANLATFVERTIRSDNALNNGVVTADSLAPSLLTSGIAPASAWATATDYPKSATAIQGGKLYRSTVEHVSGVFATDLAAGKWVFVADLVTAGKPIVILFDGQSNPEQILAFPWTPNPNATFWNGGREGVLGTAFAPLSATTIQLPAKFASDVADANPLRPVYVIAILQSGTAISHWIVGSGSGAPFVFQTALDNVTAALAAIGATKIDVYARWQGEADASPLNTSMIANLETLMTQYWAQSWFPRETPVIIFGIASTATSGITEYDQMNGLFQGFVNADPDNRKFVYPAALDSSYWDGTHIHMTAQGYFSVGAMAAREYLNGGRANAPGVTSNPATKNVAIGTPGSKSAAPFAINANASPLMPTFAGGVVSQVAGGDGVDALEWIDTFAGTGGQVARRANGTKAAPTTLAINDLIAFWGGRGYDGAAYSGAAVGLSMFAAEAWSGTAHGTYLSLYNTLPGTTTYAESVRIKPGAIVINGKTSGGITINVPDAAGSSVLTLPAGTTDFSATGGTSRVVKQISAGGPLTVAQLAFSDLSGSATASQLPAFTGGDVTSSAGSAVLTLNTVNSNVGTFGSSTQAPQVTVNGKGLVTAVSNVTVTPGLGSISGLGTGVATALAINVGSVGAPVTNGGALGSPLSAGTLPAHTLGGIVSGGGNQINNVVIGAVTPLAGSFTTLLASTSLTSPLHYGGSSAGSTLTINGTSNGSPASAYLNLQSNGQNVSIGNTTPKAPLDINANLATSPALAVSTSVMRVQAADGVAGGQEWQTYLNGATFTGNILSGAVAGGTAAAPTATPSLSYMFNLRGYAYNAGWQNAALISMVTAEAWSAGHQGTAIDTYTTAIGSTAVVLANRVNPSGGLTIGSTVDYGTGNLAAPVGGLTTAPSTTKTANYTMTTADSTIIFNGAGSLTLTLLAAASYPGRWLTIKTIAAQTVVSATSNVVPQVGGAAGTAILAGTAGKWAMLQSDGTNWVVMASN